MILPSYVIQSPGIKFEAWMKQDHVFEPFQEGFYLRSVNFILRKA